MKKSRELLHRDFAFFITLFTKPATNLKVKGAFVNPLFYFQHSSNLKRFLRRNIVGHAQTLNGCIVFSGYSR